MYDHDFASRRPGSTEIRDAHLRPPQRHAIVTARLLFRNHATATSIDNLVDYSELPASKLSDFVAPSELTPAHLTSDISSKWRHLRATHGILRGVQDTTDLCSGNPSFGVVDHKP